MKITKLELGQYDVKDGEWTRRYVINKIMPKTADVSEKTCFRGNESWSRCYRYPKNALLGQINICNNAIFYPRITKEDQAASDASRKILSKLFQ